MKPRQMFREGHISSPEAPKADCAAQRGVSLDDFVMDPRQDLAASAFLKSG
jgi:hypothetical protein